jgi:hypothetical protein
MNAHEINGGLWTIRTEMIYMSKFPLTPTPPFLRKLTLKVPISIGIIFTSFILAFSTFIRAFLPFIFDLAWTKFVTKTRIYSLWVEFNFDSQQLTKIRRERTSKWKDDAKKEKQMRKVARLEKAEKRRKREAEEEEKKLKNGPKFPV